MPWPTAQGAERLPLPSFSRFVLRDALEDGATDVVHADRGQAALCDAGHATTAVLSGCCDAISIVLHAKDASIVKRSGVMG